MVMLINGLSGVFAQSKGRSKVGLSIVDPIRSVPHFPGGKDSLTSFLKKNLHWPESEINVQGKVIVSFVVTSSGKITNLVLSSEHIQVLDNDFIKARIPLTHGSISPSDTLSIKDPADVQEYWVNDIQEV